MLCRLLGTRFAAGQDSQITIWDEIDAKLVHSIETEGRTHALTFSSFGNNSTSHGYLISGGVDMKVRIWDVDTYQLLYSFSGTDTVLSLYTFSDSPYLFSGKLHGPVDVFNLREMTFVRSFSEFETDVVFGLAEHCADTLIISSHDKVFVVDTTSLNDTNLTFSMITYPNLHSIYLLTRLRNGDFITGDSSGSLVRFSFVVPKWNNIYRWLFLGAKDEESPFSMIPIEVIYHVVSATYFDSRSLKFVSDVQ